MVYRRTPAVHDRPDARRRRIVCCAIDQVAEHGFGGCSIAAVAVRAGVSAGTVHRHFDSKGELFAEVLRILSCREVAALVEARDRGRAERDSGVDSATAAVRSFVERAVSAPTLGYALLAEPADPQVEAERLFFRQSLRDALAVAVDDAVVSCEIAPQDTTVTAACMVGAMSEALVVPLARGAADPAVVPSIVTTAIRSLGRVTLHDTLHDDAVANSSVPY